MWRGDHDHNRIDRNQGSFLTNDRTPSENTMSTLRPVAENPSPDDRRNDRISPVAASRTMAIG